MGHLPLVGVRDGKPRIRWSLLLVRLGVYFVLFGTLVYLLTWASDLLFEKHDRANLARTITIPTFLAILFVVHDLRKDLKLPSKDLPDLDRGTGSDAE